MRCIITRDDILDEAATRLADADHLITEVVGRMQGQNLMDLRREYTANRQHLLAFLADSAIRAQERLDEDDIPEAPDDSDIGRTMKQWALTHERDEEHQIAGSRMECTAPIGHYICPTCSREYYGDDLPTMAELVTWVQTGYCCDHCREETEAAPEHEFVVQWSIDVSAASYRQAAERARAMLLDPDTTATVFDVRMTGTIDVASIDLSVPEEMQSDVPPTLPDDADWVPGQ